MFCFDFYMVGINENVGVRYGVVIFFIIVIVVYYVIVFLFDLISWEFRIVID